MIGAWAADHATQLWSLGLVVFGTVVARLLRERARLRFSLGHRWDMLVEHPDRDAEGRPGGPKQVVRTASFTVTNTGHQAATKVEVTFNWKPPIFNVWPARKYEEAASPQDRYTLTFDSLAPQEQVTIETMAINAALPVLTVVRSEQCVAKEIEMGMQRIYPSWFGASALVLLLVGATTTLYLVAMGIDQLGRLSFPPPAPATVPAKPK